MHAQHHGELADAQPRGGIATAPRQLLIDARRSERVQVVIDQKGEIAVAESLEQRTSDSVATLLYDRRMPGGRGNIDLLAIAPSGVYVIDARDWSGKLKVSKPLFGEHKLLINGANRTKLIDGLDRQVAAVQQVLAHADVHVPVQGVLCLAEIDLPMLKTHTLRGHLLMYRKALAKRINAAGPLGTATRSMWRRRAWWRRCRQPDQCPCPHDETVSEGPRSRATTAAAVAMASGSGSAETRMPSCSSATTSTSRVVRPTASIAIRPLPPTPQQAADMTSKPWSFASSA